MKKFILVILVFIIASLTVSANKSQLPYARQCTKCKDDYGKDNVYITPGIMHRDFSEPNKHKDGHVYTLYRCEYGHEVWIQIDE